MSKIHWQHKKVTPDAVKESILLTEETGLTSGHVQLLRWFRSRSDPALCSNVVREYLGVSDPRDPAFRRMRDSLEALALAGYLIRGRSKSVTHYRLSTKAKAQLSRYDSA